MRRVQAQQGSIALRESLALAEILVLAHPHRRKVDREAARERLERAVRGADDRRIRPRPYAQESGHQRDRAAGLDLGRTCAAPCAPEFAFHGGANVLHRDRLERPRLELRGGDDDVIHRPALPEQVCDAFVAGHVGLDAFRPELARRGVELLRIARRDDDLGALFLCELRGGEADP